ncbi:MAG: hypothetical protein ACYS9T_01495 [Planctomycetota bacterium]|jgi:hypothetical protein
MGLVKGMTLLNARQFLPCDVEVIAFDAKVCPGYLAMPGLSMGNAVFL